MKLIPALFKSRNSARSAQNEKKVKFQPLYPLSLKNVYRGGISASPENKCLFEMQLLFQCWQKNDFQDNLCEQFVKQLNRCHEQYTTHLAREKEHRKQIKPVPGTKNLTDKQINYLLHKYPNV